MAQEPSDNEPGLTPEALAAALEDARRAPDPQAETPPDPETALGTEPISSTTVTMDLSEVEQLKAQLEFSLAKGREMMERVKDSHERMLRAAADLENYKRRAQKEKEEVQKFGVEKLLKDLLPVIDNLDRALAQEDAGEGFRQGVSMTRKLFEDTLAKHGVRSFESVGLPFDPRRHEAIQQTPTDAVPPQHVVSEVLKGYTLQDRLARPAMVVVSIPRPEGGDENHG